MKLTFDNFDEDFNDENENDYDLDVIMNHEYCDPYLFFNLNQDHINEYKKYVDNIDPHDWWEDRYDFTDEKNRVIEDYRNVLVHNAENDSVIARVGKQMFEESNDNNFNNDVDNDACEYQVLKYGEGGNYKWHCDYGSSKYADQGYTRKLSMSINISDSSEYKGGSLEVIDYCNRSAYLPKHSGSGIVFDSRLPHRATSVVKGTRIVLVAWMSGPPLR